MCRPFSFSFAAAQGPAGHWRQLEEGGEEPLRFLVELLERPYGTVDTAEGTQHVWPSAFAAETWEDVPREDREALRPLYGEEDLTEFDRFGSYAGYGVGIDETGGWLFFIGGD